MTTTWKIGASLFSAAPAGSTQVNGFKCQKKKCWLNIMKFFLPVRAAQHWTCASPAAAQFETLEPAGQPLKHKQTNKRTKKEQEKPLLTQPNGFKKLVKLFSQDSWAFFLTTRLSQICLFVCFKTVEWQAHAQRHKNYLFNGWNSIAQSCKQSNFWNHFATY